MPGKMTIEELEELVGTGEIDTVVAAFTDMQGRLIGKRVTGHYFLDAVHKEWHACDYLLALDMEMEPVPGFAVASWERGYGDFAVRPDLSTLRRIPWLPGTALVLGDVCDHEGNELAHSPRAMLKRQLARLAERDLGAKMASELEFYVFDEDYRTCRDKDYRDLRTAGWYIEDYHVFETTKREPLMRAIRNGMDAAGVPVEFSKGEWGPGQEELNLVYAEALEMADRHVIYKNGVKEIAHLQGKAVTFMAKWRQDLAGNSCHIHASLWTSDGRPAFVDEAGHENDTFRHFLAGQLALAREYTLFLAPYVNSYKRFQAGSFAPTNIVWSRDNRTAGFRIVGHGPSTRVECRMPGADVNPYLAYTAMLAAGLHGIDHRLDPGPEYTGDAYRSHEVPALPRTLREAAELLDGSTALRAALGDAVVDHYVHAARWEVSVFDQVVTDWERLRYFERA